MLDGIDLTLCVLLFPLTPCQGVWAGRTVQTHWSQSRALPTGTKSWVFSLWKKNREGWWEAMCQSIEQIFMDSGSRSVLGFLGEPLSISGFYLQQTGTLLPMNTVPEGFQTKGFDYFPKLPQRLNKNCKCFYFLFLWKNTQISISPVQVCGRSKEEEAFWCSPVF